MSKELTVEHIPNLVVAKDVNGLYIPIGNADKHNEYYCPVCNNIVKPRALSSKKEQPHYYHVNDECSKESQLHWLYKNWLLVKNTEIIIGNKAYVVKDCEVEPTIETKFGVYNPDLRITTMDNNIFYFEMAYSNKKDQTYCDKWDDLNAEVVEVDIKELINSNSKNVLPKFDLIYTNGKYTKNYEKRERKDKYYSFKNALKYDERKELIKDLDWLWSELNNEDVENICLDNIGYNVLVDVTRWFKQIKCIDKYEQFIRYCQKRFKDDLSNMFSLATVDIKRMTSKRVKITMELKINNFSFYDFDLECVSTKMDGLICELPLDYFKKYHHEFIEEYETFKQYVKLYDDIGSNVDFTECDSYDFYKKRNLLYIVVYKQYKNKKYKVFDDILNEKNVAFIKNNIGDSFDNIAKDMYEDELIINKYKADIEENIEKYNMLLKKRFPRYLLEKIGYCQYYLKTFEFANVYSNTDIEDMIRLKKDLTEALDEKNISPKEKKMIEIVNQINNCKNKRWRASYETPFLALYLLDDEQRAIVAEYITNKTFDKNLKEIKDIIKDTMIDMINNTAYSHHTRIFLEVANEEK